MWNPVCRACRVCFASRANIDSHACRSVHSSGLLSICLDFVYLPICPPLYLADTCAHCRENLILGVLLCEVGRATSIVWTAKTTPVYSSLAWHADAKQHTCTNRRCNQSFHCLLMIVPMSSLCTSKCLVCGKRSKGVALAMERGMEIQTIWICEPCKKLPLEATDKGSSCKGFFPKNYCQSQLFTLSTQHLLHPLHPQYHPHQLHVHHIHHFHHLHHLHQLHVHHNHHLHHLHQLQSTSSESHTYLNFIYMTCLLQHFYYNTPTLSFAQELSHRSSDRGVVTKELVVAQELLHRTCFTGVITQELTSRRSSCIRKCLETATSQVLLNSFLRRQGQWTTCLRKVTLCGNLVRVGRATWGEMQVPKCRNGDCTLCGDRV